MDLSEQEKCASSLYMMSLYP